MPPSFPARPPLLLAVALVASLTGCQSWARRDLAHPLPATAVVEVWTAETVYRLRAVRLTPDSVLGMHIHPTPERGDTAGEAPARSIALARTAVDSVRVREADLGKIVILSGAAAIAYLLYLGAGLSGMQ